VPAVERVAIYSTRITTNGGSSNSIPLTAGRILSTQPHPIMNVVILIVKYFGFGFTALLPVINPLGSALVFLGFVGPASSNIYRTLARQIAVNTILFFLVIELVGSALLNFFGISLAIVQVAGGLVLAAMGWSLLNEKDPDAKPAPDRIPSQPMLDSFEEKTFYPLTFPVTAGPGCIVVMLTLSAHASKPTFRASKHALNDVLFAHLGISLAVVALSVLVYLSYAYAPRITQAISPTTANGILRVIAFILLCIGVQITWNGLQPLLSTLIRPS
jgi:multiple antibiotic resistance protein